MVNEAMTFALMEQLLKAVISQNELILRYAAEKMRTDATGTIAPSMPSILPPLNKEIFNDYSERERGDVRTSIDGRSVVSIEPDTDPDVWDNAGP